MQAMDGPINFGENDKYWGLLIWGFTHPSFGMSYNPSYYQSLFEDYGFRKLYDQETTHINIRAPFTTRFSKIADWVMKKPRSEEHTSELQSLMRTSYAVFCLKKNKK